MEPFPYEEIDRFETLEEARAAGYDDDQIWSVIEGDYCPDWLIGIFTYGPCHHYANLMYYVCTKQRMGNRFTEYYEDVVERDDFDKWEWLENMVKNDSYSIDLIYRELGDYLQWRDKGQLP